MKYIFKPLKFFLTLACVLISDNNILFAEPSKEVEVKDIKKKLELHTKQSFIEHIASQYKKYKIGTPYVINGIKHHPHEDFEYRAIGRASWYGDADHLKTTATGVTFNHYDLTAAHRTLPMPSIVYVTNLENNKKIRLLINDRGPFAKMDRRIIDVSKQAAKYLGFYKKGSANVLVELDKEASLNLRNAIKNQSKKYDTTIIIQEINKLSSHFAKQLKNKIISFSKANYTTNKQNKQNKNLDIAKLSSTPDKITNRNAQSGTNKIMPTNSVQIANLNKDKNIDAANLTKKPEDTVDLKNKDNDKTIIDLTIKENKITKRNIYDIYLQVASFSKKDNAVILKTKINNLLASKKTFIQPVQNNKLFKLYIGPISYKIIGLIKRKLHKLGIKDTLVVEEI